MKPQKSLISHDAERAVSLHISYGALKAPVVTVRGYSGPMESIFVDDNPIDNESPKIKRTHRYIRRKTKDIQCALCKKTIYSPRINQIYCSTKCRKRANYIHKKIAHPDGNPK